MSKHTPGPWHYAAGYVSTYVNGDYIVLAELHSKFGTDNFGDDDPLMLGPKERSANGRLMAAAPEMLELIQQVADLQNPRNYNAAYNDLVIEQDRLADLAQELLAKIEEAK